MDIPTNVWLALGLLGQAIFSGRFLLQWLHSERRRQSLIPLSFWYASIAGSVLLLVYSIHIRDPVFITGQSGGLLIYLRNLQLLRREAKAQSSEGAR